MGIALFGTLIFASVILTRITEWVVQGVSPERVVQLAVLMLPAILIKSAAMAALLACLLGFGRLGGDSEIVAIRASGASLFRVMRPVFMASMVVAAILFVINESMVPWASQQATALQIEVRREADKLKGARNINRAVTLGDGTTLMLSAIDFSLVSQTLSKASMVVYNKERQAVWWVQADEMKYVGDRDWRLYGKVRLISGDGHNVIDLEDGIWPKEIEKPDLTPSNLLAGVANDLDVFSMKQIYAEIETMRREPIPNTRVIANLEFGFWNKIALPLNVVIFSLLGSPLGIRHQRTGVGTGFAVSIGVTFLYIMVSNLLAVYSKSGAIPPFAASFTPVLLGGVAAALAIWRKNG